MNVKNMKIYAKMDTAQIRLVALCVPVMKDFD